MNFNLNERKKISCTQIIIYIHLIPFYIFQLYNSKFYLLNDCLNSYLIHKRILFNYVFYFLFKTSNFVISNQDKSFTNAYCASTEDLKRFLIIKTISTFHKIMLPMIDFSFNKHNNTSILLNRDLLNHDLIKYKPYEQTIQVSHSIILKHDCISLFIMRQDNEL